MLGSREENLMSAIQGFMLVFQMALLAIAVAAKVGFATPVGGVHEATPLPTAPAHSGTHALL
jgi:hypothetical protein